MLRTISVFLTILVTLSGCSGDENEGCQSSAECDTGFICTSDGQCLEVSVGNNANNDGNNNDNNDDNNGTDNNGMNNENNVGAATRDDCVGSYIGNYSGDLTGSVNGDMDESGALEVTFSDGQNSSLDASGQVTEVGLIIAGASIVSIDGQANFEDCSVTGTWMNAQVGAGMWTAVIQ